MNIKNTKHIILCAILFVIILLGPILVFFLITQKELTTNTKSIKPIDKFCIQGTFLFPTLYEVKASFPTEVEIRDKTTIFNKIDIFAKEICLKPNTTLSANTPYILTLSYLGVFQKEIKILTTDYPQIKEPNPKTTIDPNQIITYELDYTSESLNYTLVLDDTKTLCTKENNLVHCNIASLNLRPDSAHKLNLVSSNKTETVNTLISTNITVLSPVNIVSTSIQQNEIIQSLSIPEIKITLNKEIDKNFNTILEDNLKNKVTCKASVTGSKIFIQPQSTFKQNTAYTLKLNQLIGLDGSQLEKEYTLEFSIGNGPKITKTNTSSAFPTTGNIVITFNQNLKNSQDIKKFITLNSGTDYSYTISKNKITINPSHSLTLCKKYSLNIAKGLKGSTNLISTSNSSYTFKTTCKRTVPIGTSVQGRSIYAYYFGTGSKKIVFFGSIHGSEANTKTTLNRWVTELENNNSRIPSDKTIIVIPTVNPDGIANKSRFNANGVDLNRNFDTTNWVTGTYLQTHFYPTGGGSNPFSEPESQDIRNLINRENPYITLTYHSAAGYVIPTNTGTGVALGKIYSQLSGYRYVAPGTTGSFTYDITGTFEEWAEEHGHNALVIELSSAYYDQFIQNSKAMWRMVEN